MNLSADAASHWWVICLCAEWCGVCREWRDAFSQAAAAHPELRFAWVDVEDEADAMGDVDIETFPTVLIAREGKPLFFGPVLPSGTQFTRLIASLRDTPHGAAVSQEAAPLLVRLADTVLPKR
jgi:thioredoxin 1